MARRRGEIIRLGSSPHNQHSNDAGRLFSVLAKVIFGAG